MPKLSLSKERELVERMARNLAARCVMLGYRSENDISKKIGMARTTYRNRKADAASWRMIEFARAAVALGTTLEWLCKDHSKECKEDK